jgi:poly-gamma-glutamate synthesis protein (capsule biosynthesis protein)
LLRGIEVHNGKPIFYSLGNFIFHYEYVSMLPGENFSRHSDRLPSDFFRRLHKDGTEGFPRDRRYWQSIVPVCTFENGSLAEMELHPLDLGVGSRPPRRGTPELASAELHQEISVQIARLSEPFGTRLRLDTHGTHVELD